MYIKKHVSLLTTYAFFIYLFFNLFIEGIVSSTLFSVTFQNRAVRVLAAVKCRDKSNEKKTLA